MLNIILYAKIITVAYKDDRLPAVKVTSEPVT